MMIAQTYGAGEVFVAARLFLMIAIFVALLLIVLGMVYLPRKGKIVLVISMAATFFVGLFAYQSFRPEGTKNGLDIIKLETSPMPYTYTGAEQGVPYPDLEITPRVRSMYSDNIAKELNRTSSVSVHGNSNVVVKSGRGSNVSIDMNAPVGISAESPAIPPSANVEMDADASDYPSMRSAVVAGFKKLLQSLDDDLQANERLERVLINDCASRAEDKADILRAIKPYLGNAKIETETFERRKTWTSEQTPEGTIRLMALEASPGSNTKSTLEVVLHSASTLRSIDLSVRDTPWLDDFEAFRHDFIEKNPGGFVSVVDSAYQSSPEAAASNVDEQALDLLLPLIRTRMRETSTKYGNTSPEQNKWLIDSIRSDIASGKFYPDRFNQTIRKPYGNVYRQWLLVQAPEPAIRGAARRYVSVLEAQRESMMHKLISAGGLVLFICVTYLFLNAATKGYYAWSLRLLGAVVVVVGIAVLLRVA